MCDSVNDSSIHRIVYLTCHHPTDGSCIGTVGDGVHVVTSVPIHAMLPSPRFLFSINRDSEGAQLFAMKLHMHLVMIDQLAKGTFTEVTHLVFLERVRKVPGNDQSPVVEWRLHTMMKRWAVPLACNRLGTLCEVSEGIAFFPPKELLEMAVPPYFDRKRGHNITTARYISMTRHTVGGRIDVSNGCNTPSVNWKSTLAGTGSLGIKSAFSPGAAAAMSLVYKTIDASHPQFLGHKNGDYYNIANEAFFPYPEDVFQIAFSTDQMYRNMQQLALPTLEVPIIPDPEEIAAGLSAAGMSDAQEHEELPSYAIRDMRLIPGMDMAAFSGTYGDFARELQVGRPRRVYIKARVSVEGTIVREWHMQAELLTNELADAKRNLNNPAKWNAYMLTKGIDFMRAYVTPSNTERVSTAHAAYADYFVEHICRRKAMSPGGGLFVASMAPGISRDTNYVLWLRHHMDKCYSMHSLHALCENISLGMSSAQDFTNGTMRLNMLIIGEGGAGKSFAVDLAKSLTVLGTWVERGTSSEAALTSEKGASYGLVVIYHEADPRLMGIGGKGDSGSAEAMLKHLMTSGKVVYSVTILKKDIEGMGVEFSKVVDRSTVHEIATCDHVIIACINDKSGDISGALRTRMQICGGVSSDRADGMSITESIFRGEHMEGAIRKHSLVTSAHRDISWLTYILRMAVGMNVFEKPTLSVTRALLPLMLNELMNAGVRISDPRHYERIKSAIISRVFTLAAMALWIYPDSKFANVPFSWDQVPYASAHMHDSAAIVYHCFGLIGIPQYVHMLQQPILTALRTSCLRGEEAAWQPLNYERSAHNLDSGAEAEDPNYVFIPTNNIGRPNVFSLWLSAADTVLAALPTSVRPSRELVIGALKCMEIMKIPNAKHVDAADFETYQAARARAMPGTTPRPRAQFMMEKAMTVGESGPHGARVHGLIISKTFLATDSGDYARMCIEATFDECTQIIARKVPTDMMDTFTHEVVLTIGMVIEDTMQELTRRATMSRPSNTLPQDNVLRIIDPQASNASITESAQKFHLITHLCTVGHHNEGGVEVRIRGGLEGLRSLVRDQYPGRLSWEVDDAFDRIVNGAIDFSALDYVRTKLDGPAIRQSQADSGAIIIGRHLLEFCMHTQYFVSTGESIEGYPWMMRLIPTRKNRFKRIAYASDSDDGDVQEYLNDESTADSGKSKSFDMFLRDIMSQMADSFADKRVDACNIDMETDARMTRLYAVDEHSPQVVHDINAYIQYVIDENPMGDTLGNCGIYPPMTIHRKATSYVARREVGGAPTKKPARKFVQPMAPGNGSGVRIEPMKAAPPVQQPRPQSPPPPVKHINPIAVRRRLVAPPPIAPCAEVLQPVGPTRSWHANGKAAKSCSLAPPAPSSTTDTRDRWLHRLVRDFTTFSKVTSVV